MPIFPPSTSSGSGVTKRSVCFDASSGTPVILGADGVGSITDNGAGDFTVNFTAMPNANYAAFINGRALAGATNAGFFGMENHDFVVRSTTQLRIYTLAADVITPTDWPRTSVMVIA